jgi:uncharacterized metal-binding protein YceD (DUF177 family)
VKDGSLKLKLAKLNELILEEHTEVEKKKIKKKKKIERENIDPRWDKLKQLLTDK